MEIKSIVEALIFAAGRVIDVGEIVTILEEILEGPQANPKEVREVLQSLIQEWEEKGRGIRLVSVAQGYEFRTTPQYAAWLRLLNRPKPQRLSTPAVESLALTAYRQPVTRSDIENVRGVDSGGVLKNLLDRRLIRIVGRKEEPGRPILYATTKEFLELFGLKDLSDLPPLSEFEEMIKSQASEKTADETPFSLSDLISTSEEQMEMEGTDRKVLEDLDESLRSLKDLEKSLEPSPAGSVEIPKTEDA